MGEHGVEYRSCNVLEDEESVRLWEEAGRPVIPSLVFDGVAVPILHRSQLARLLDLPLREEAGATALAWDCVLVLDAWVAALRGLSFCDLTVPTHSRGRSLRNLTVNVFHPFELVPGALEEGGFPWDPDGDAEREAGLGTAESVVEYAAERAAGWRWFLAGLGDRLAEELPPVSSPRGEIAFADLLAQQRWHAAFHYRQLVAHREEAGWPIAIPFAVDRLGGLDLPPEVF